MYSRLLLTEPFYVLFLLTSLLCSVEYVRTRALRWLIATAVGASCLQLTKYNGCLVAVPLLAVLACEAVTREYGEERSRAFRHGLILGGIVAGTIVSNVAVLTAFGVFSRFIRTYSGYIRGEPVSPAGLVQYLQLVTPLPVLYLAIAGMAYAAWERRSISWAIVHLGFILYVVFTFIYTFYLRLLAPLSVFLIIYASLVIDALFSSRARVARVATLMIAVLFGFDTWRDFSRYVVRDFSGYSRASALLNGLGDGAPVLMLTQHNVWRELTRTVSFLPNAPPDEIVIPPDAHHVYLVTDLYAYYKYGHRQYVSRLASLQDRLVARIPNPLVYEPVENQLTILELVRLETDRALRDQLFSISVFRLTPSEARDALTSGESKMPRDAAETFVGGRAAR
jgi:hypothetical protein